MHIISIPLNVSLEKKKKKSERIEQDEGAVITFQESK